MNIYNSIEDCLHLENAVVTLGMYDGVHIGHQTIIRQLNDTANKVGGESVLLTFSPHPRKVIQPDFQMELLSTLDEKENILEEYGLDNFIVHPFTKEFSQISSIDFVVEYLIKKLNLHTLIIGHDHHFGKNREGNFEQLKVLSKEYGFNLIQLQAVEEGDIAISSTKIRNALKEGNIEFANKALNYNYPITGKVVHGDKIGRTLGFPTANLEVDSNKLIPKDGVYAVDVFVDNKKYLGLLSIGYRETVTNSREHRVEVNILNFNKDIYGETIRLEFRGRLRDEKKFNSLDDLISAMNQDKENAIKKYSS
ncbi:riboflavin kinase / FMN adenylyltransferase [Chishuiella changwenlii]|uniref:Riboflavin biosynthesis protein n=1 Tax=Chishuiella changwenlii TaxID=1434701 RepID=A0A1M7CAJ1_9FLAO|nr:bifunctional riboflavin kinase/FAD synthetase [Chishuiella changwenlii]SHL64265.1 riboflavin kinase / FMN adenylyltransferase [Chishuiella changwenlii]